MRLQQSQLKAPTRIPSDPIQRAWVALGRVSQSIQCHVEEALKKAEDERALSRLKHLSPQDRATVEAYGTALINKILHQPSVRLKSAEPREAARLTQAVRSLFNLDSGGDDEADDEEA